MKDKLSKCLRSFRKSHGTQHLLVATLENGNKAVGKGECVSTFFLDLSKAFDAINHDLLATSKIKGLCIFTECTKINA